MKTLAVSLFIFCFSITCKSQKATSQQAVSFEFSEITFHSSECNGTCPDISMTIYSDKKVKLSRTIYKMKGVADTSKSGGFKGFLNQKDFDKLISLLKEIDWENVHFPKVTCCDGPVRTIILLANDEYRKFKSMSPPDVTEELISFLSNLAVTVKLPLYEKPMDFEVIID